MTDTTDRLLYDPTPRPDATFPPTRREAELLAEIRHLKIDLDIYRAGLREVLGRQNLGSCHDAARAALGFVEEAARDE